MKRKLSYPELWQQKRNELPVAGNPNADWLQMRSLLDKQMPVMVPVKKPFRFKVPKWGIHVFTGVSVTAAAYLGSLYFSKKDHKPATPAMQQIHRDSVPHATKDPMPLQSLPKPGVLQPAPVPADQTKPGQDITVKPLPPSIDSTERPPVLNLTIRHDSLPVPSEARKPANDSAGVVQVKRRNIPIDTTSINRKPVKKKKRTKLSVFF